MAGDENSFEGPVAVVLFGSPGSGKGTQAAFISDWLGIPHISTGEILREHVRRGNEIGLAIQKLLGAGSLVSDELVNDLVRQRTAEPDCGRGFILDGYPRTTAQADVMAGVLAGAGIREVVIHLAVDYNVIISRITGRRVCPDCGTVYNAKSRPPKSEGVCDLDGATLAVRDDDREEVVRERLEQYERQTRPLIEFFRNGDHSLIEVEASRRSPDEVFGMIRMALERVGGTAAGR